MADSKVKDPAEEIDVSVNDADNEITTPPNEVEEAQNAYDNAPKRKGKVGRKTNKEKQAAEELRIKTIKADIQKEHPSIFAKREEPIQVNDTPVNSSKKVDTFLKFDTVLRKSKEPNTDYNEVLSAITKYKWNKIDNYGNYILEVGDSILQYNGFELPTIDGEPLSSFINDDPDDILGSILKAIGGKK